MISVSGSWAALQNETLQPETFVEITYTVTEPGVQEEAVASANYPEDFSDVDQVLSTVDKNSEKYSTLDYGCWGLDGSYSYFDGSPVDPGYVNSNYTESDGSIGVSPYPTIMIDLAKRHDILIPGLTITWSDTFGGWATDFRITASNSNGIVAQATVTGNKDVVSTIWLDIVEYSQITVEVLKWSHPYQRVRCMDIQLGIQKIYTKNDLLGYDHNQSVDLLSAVLPENSITFKLRNDDVRWNPDTPTGNEKYLLEQQEVRVRYGMDVNGSVEWIKGGTFWLSEWSTPSNGLEAVFTARDSIEFMGSNYTGPRSGTLYDIAIAALTEANLTVMDNGSFRYYVDESLKQIETDFTWDDSDYTVAEILQMVAHAGCCVFYQDRDGIVRIEPWKKIYSGYKIEPSISYSHPEYTFSKPLKAVAVEYGENALVEILDVNSRGEIQTISNPLISTKEDAIRVGMAAVSVLEHRKEVSGEFRSDLRLDALDNIIVTSKYASNILGITGVNISTTGGTFRGTYTGRVISIDLAGTKIYSDEIYAGEVW